MGEHLIVLTVTDEQGFFDSDEIVVTVTRQPRSQYVLSIETTGGGETTPGAGTTVWPANTSVELQAVPSEGSQFVRWSGDLDSSLSSTVILMDGDKFISAEFEALRADELPKFFLPLPPGQSRRVSQGNLQGPTHQDDHAWDFPMPVGTPVTAAGAGRVIDVLESSPRNDPDSAVNLGAANFVTIDHGGGLRSIYVHLDFEGAAVAPGQLVTRGQVIGFSCDTGQSTGPHLHYSILDVLGNSVPSGFWDLSAGLEVPRTDDVVVSRNELSIESAFGYQPSALPPDAFLVNQIELTGETPPAFIYETATPFRITGRVLDGKRKVCVALVDPDTSETAFCDLTDVLPDGTFDIPFEFPPELDGKHFMGVISGDAGVEGVVPIEILILPPDDEVAAPIAIVVPPAGSVIDFLDTRTLVEQDSISFRNTPLTYQWVQVSGPPATIADPTASQTDFTLELGGGIRRVSFQLTVFDGVKYSRPGQVEFFMPDTFAVKRINVADATCDSADECPDLDPPVVSFSTGVISGWVELVNVNVSDVLEYQIVDPSARLMRQGELTISTEPPATSFWRFGWSSLGLNLTPGQWAGVFKRNGVTEATVAFRVVP